MSGKGRATNTRWHITVLAPSSHLHNEQKETQPMLSTAGHTPDKLYGHMLAQIIYWREKGREIYLLAPSVIFHWFKFGPQGINFSVLPSCQLCFLGSNRRS